MTTILLLLSLHWPPLVSYQIFVHLLYGLTRRGKQWSLRFINNINSVTNSKKKAYEWVVHDIEQAFSVTPEKNEYGYEEDIITVLNEDQINAIEAYCESGEWIEGYCRSALHSIIDRWYEENEVLVP